MVQAPQRPQTQLARNAVIPPELKNLRQWARWVKGSRDKMPANLDGSAMKWGDPANWLTFDQVSSFGKIGYFHSLESGIIGIDFDGCIDENGVIHPLVLGWMGYTYAEYSPSKRGIKAYFKGTIPNGKAIITTDVPWRDPAKDPKEDHTGTEIYAQKRFFTVTGDLIPGCPSEINEVPEILNDILVHFAKAPKPKRKESPVLTNDSWDWNAWVMKHLDVVETLADGYSVTCPWAHEHTTPGDTARIWEGPPHTFSCFHAHCDGREWGDVRVKYEPTAYDKRDQWQSKDNSSTHTEQPHESDEPSQFYKEVMTQVMEAIEKQDVEKLYFSLAGKIGCLPDEEREYLAGKVQGGMAKCKTFRWSSFKGLMEKAAKKQKAATHDDTQKYRKLPSGMALAGDDGLVPISNFAAEIVSDIKVDDGAEITRIYEINAELNERHFNFEVLADQFEDCKWKDKEIGARARITVGPRMKEHLCYAIRECSDAEEKDFFGHIGWRKIKDTMAYLHNEGYLSEVSEAHSEDFTHLTHSFFTSASAYRATSHIQVSEVSEVSEKYIKAAVKLTGSLSKYAFPSERDSIQQSIRASLAIVDITQDIVTMPLYAAAWRAPLGNIDFGVHVAGQTGLGKSELTALIQQHYGASMDARNFPGSWDSTKNALEMKLSQTRDAVFTLDDFKPKGNRNMQEQLHAKADDVFRAMGNGSARDRLDANINLRVGRYPRCLLISTGEDIPQGQSCQSRMVVVTMTESVTKGEAAKRLNIAQKDARDGLYAQAMAGYIEWLAPRIEAIQSQWPSLRDQERDQLSNEGHSRAGTNIANLILGMKCFLQYACEMDAISLQEAESYLRRCISAFMEIASDASRENYHMKPSELWKRLLVSAIVGNRAHLVDVNGDNPGPGYGWKKSVRCYTDPEGNMVEDETYSGGGSKIGWIVDDNIYLIPNAAYSTIVEEGRKSGENITTSQTMLNKDLVKDGILASTDLHKDAKHRSTAIRKRGLEGGQPHVLHVKKEILFPNDPPPESPRSSRSSHSEPHEAASEGASEVSEVNPSEASEGGNIPPSDTTQTHNTAHFDGIPDAHRELLQEYQDLYKQMGQVPRKRLAPLGDIHWRVPGSGYEEVEQISVDEYQRRLKELYESNDLRKVTAGRDEMQRKLALLK